MPNRPSPITYEVMVDWDATNWAANPIFVGDDDISDDVRFNGISRGKEDEEGNAPAGTLQIKLKAGLVAKYSPWTAGVLVGRIRPWLPVRIIATHLTIPYARYFGFISSIKVDPRPDKQSVTLYCTDGTDLLARQMIAQDYETKTQMSDGAAVNLVLDSAGWSGLRRDIDTDGGAELLNYPDVAAY